MTNIFTVSIILFKVQTTNDYSTKALKKRSMHKFVLTERVPGETAADNQEPSWFYRLKGI